MIEPTMRDHTAAGHQVWSSSGIGFRSRKASPSTPHIYGNATTSSLFSDGTRKTGRPHSERAAASPHEAAKCSGGHGKHCRCLRGLCPREPWRIRRPHSLDHSAHELRRTSRNLTVAALPVEPTSPDTPALDGANAPLVLRNAAVHLTPHSAAYRGRSSGTRGIAACSSLRTHEHSWRSAFSHPESALLSGRKRPRSGHSLTPPAPCLKLSCSLCRSFRKPHRSGSDSTNSHRLTSNGCVRNSSAASPSRSRLMNVTTSRKSTISCGSTFLISRSRFGCSVLTSYASLNSSRSRRVPLSRRSRGDRRSAQVASALPRGGAARTASPDRQVWFGARGERAGIAASRAAGASTEETP